MICPVCQGKDHRLYERGASSSTMYAAPYWENGVYHFHDGNTRNTKYECSNGHYVYTRSNGNSCPAVACDFKGSSETTVSYKCDTCGDYSLVAEDDDCKSCLYLAEKAAKEAKDALWNEYKAVPGWNRRKMTFEQWLTKRNST